MAHLKIIMWCDLIITWPNRSPLFCFSSNLCVPQIRSCTLLVLCLVPIEFVKRRKNAPCLLLFWHTTDVYEWSFQHLSTGCVLLIWWSKFCRRRQLGEIISLADILTRRLIVGLRTCIHFDDFIITAATQVPNALINPVLGKSNNKISHTMKSFAHLDSVVLWIVSGSTSPLLSTVFYGVNRFKDEAVRHIYTLFPLACSMIMLCLRLLVVVAMICCRSVWLGVVFLCSEWYARECCPLHNMVEHRYR